MKTNPADLQAAKEAAKRLYKKVNFSGGPLQSYQLSSLLNDTYEYLKIRKHHNTQPTNPTTEISKYTQKYSTTIKMDKSHNKIFKHQPSSTYADQEYSTNHPAISQTKNNPSTTKTPTTYSTNPHNPSPPPTHKKTSTIPGNPSPINTIKNHSPTTPAHSPHPPTKKNSMKKLSTTSPSPNPSSKNTPPNTTPSPQIESQDCSSKPTVNWAEKTTNPTKKTSKSGCDSATKTTTATSNTTNTANL